MRRPYFPLGMRLGLGAMAGYLATRMFYSRWNEGAYHDVRRLYREEQMFAELAWILLMPLAIAVVLQVFGRGRNDIFLSACAACAACAYVGARQVFLLDYDVQGEWYAANFVRGLVWLFGAGIILPAFAGRIPARMMYRRRAEPVAAEAE